MKGLTVAGFKVTDHSLEVMRAAGVPEEILLKLATIKDQRVSGKTHYISLLQQTIGYQETATYLPLILKSTAVRRIRHRGGLKQPSLGQYLFKVLHSTILGIAILLASFIMDFLYRKLYEGTDNPSVDFIKSIDSLASAGLFVIFLTVKVIHNLGIVGD